MSTILKQAGANLARSLASGLILVFFSERLFWSVWRPGDSVGDQIMTWLAYSTAAYLFLSVVVLFAANRLWSMCLAGAFYGWFVEGTFAPTLYGTEGSAPFPLSLSVTGLSWHMLISVMIGWYGLQRALASRTWVPLAILLAGVGVFWGAWATFLWRETPPVITTPGWFMMHAITMTASVAVAVAIQRHPRLPGFRPGPVGLLISMALPGLFYAEQVKRLGWFPLVLLPTMLCVALVPLWRGRRRSRLVAERPIEKGGSAKHLVLFAVLPLVATLVYILGEPLGFGRVPISTIVYYWITAPAGTALFLVAWVRCWRGSPG